MKIKDFERTEHIISKPNDPMLNETFSLYNKIFTLKNEKESLTGFKKVLQDFNNKRYFERYGPWKELWISIKDPSNNKVIGAINFSLYFMPEPIIEKHHISATSHILYIFIDPEYRKKGLGEELLNLMEKYCKREMKGNKIVYFYDQNNPRLMSKKEYKHDTYNSGIDQNERIKWWRDRGFRFIDMEFILPPLGKNKKDCKILSLGIKNINKAYFPSEIVLEHLKRFFEISVLKGKDLSKIKDFIKQQDFLIKNKKVKILS